MVDTVLNLRIALLVCALFANTHALLCSVIPCYLRPPSPLQQPIYYSHQTYYRPSSGYGYPTYYPPPRIVHIIVVKQLDQTKDDQSPYHPGYVWNKPPSELNPPEIPQSAVQVLTPPSTGLITQPPASTTADLTPTALPATKPSAPISIPSFSGSSPTSASPNQENIPTLPASSQYPIIVKPGSPPTEESKLLDSPAGGVIPSDTSGHRSDSWRQNWLNPVSVTSPALCKTNNDEISDETHHQCLTTCQEAYNRKLESIGLTRTGVIFLGGSCKHEEGQKPLCKCFMRLGMEYESFSVTNQE